jgi:hypothetical protein
MNYHTLITASLNGSTSLDLREVYRCTAEIEGAGVVEFHATGKHGTRFVDGVEGVELSATYSLRSWQLEARLWVYADGTYMID